VSTAKQWEQLANEAIADAGEWKRRAQLAEKALVLHLNISLDEVQNVLKRGDK